MRGWLTLSTVAITMRRNWQAGRGIKAASVWAQSRTHPRKGYLARLIVEDPRSSLGSKPLMQSAFRSTPRAAAARSTSTGAGATRSVSTCTTCVRCVLSADARVDCVHPRLDAISEAYCQSHCAARLHPISRIFLSSAERRVRDRRQEAAAGSGGKRRLRLLSPPAGDYTKGKSISY